MMAILYVIVITGFFALVYPTVPKEDMISFIGIYLALLVLPFLFPKHEK